MFRPAPITACRIYLASATSIRSSSTLRKSNSLSRTIWTRTRSTTSVTASSTATMVAIAHLSTMTRAKMTQAKTARTMIILIMVCRSTVRWLTLTAHTMKPTANTCNTKKRLKRMVQRRTVKRVAGIVTRRRPLLLRQMRTLSKRMVPVVRLRLEMIFVLITESIVTLATVTLTVCAEEVTTLTLSITKHPGITLRGDTATVDILSSSLTLMTMILTRMLTSLAMMRILMAMRRMIYSSHCIANTPAMMMINKSNRRQSLCKRRKKLFQQQRILIRNSKTKSAMSKKNPLLIDTIGTIVIEATGTDTAETIKYKTRWLRRTDPIQKLL